jgi:acyl carrier protein
MNKKISADKKKTKVKVKSKLKLTDEEIKKDVIEIISNLSKIPKERIDLKEHFTAAGLDSFTIVEIIFAIENKFEIDIPQDSLSGIQNVGELIELIKQLLEKRG